MSIDPKAASAIRNGNKRWVVTFSRRTDAVRHLDWLWDKILKGGAYYKNPQNPGQVCYCTLRPERVKILQPWTKDPVSLAPWIPRYLDRGFKVSVFCTVNGYPRFIEPGVPEAQESVKALKRIRGDYGVEVRWRYDPCFFAEGLDRGRHLENFRRLAGELSGSVTEAVTSFVQIEGMYRDIKSHFMSELARNGMPYRPAGQQEMEDLLCDLTEIAGGFGISLGVCCYPKISEAGRKRGVCQTACVSMSFLRKTCPFLEELPLKPTRANCLCRESRDIGATSLCMGPIGTAPEHACIYCYANRWSGMRPSTTPIPPSAPWLSADPLPEGYPYPVGEAEPGLFS